MKTRLSLCYRVPSNQTAVPSWFCFVAILLLYLNLSTATFAQNKIWDKTIGGNRLDQLNAMQSTRDGGYILGGWSLSDKSGHKSEESKGGEDYWIVKLNADGAKVWDKTIGGDNNDQLFALQQTSDGGYILGGTSFSGSSGDKSEASKSNGYYSDYWIVKLNADGSKAWDKTIGGDGTDELFALQQTSDGGYILAGRSQSNISGDKSQERFAYTDFWVVKLKADGTKVWDKTVGESTSLTGSIRQTTDGGYIVGGLSSFEVGSHFEVVKLNADGSKAWNKVIASNNNDDLITVQQTREGGYILGGHSSSGIGGDKSEANRGGLDYWIVKLTANGMKVWDKTLGGNDNDFFTSIQQTLDNGYIVGGFSYSRASGDKYEDSDYEHGNGDAWVVKLNADGTKDWDETIGGDDNDNLQSIIQTSDESFVLGASALSGISGDKSQASKGDFDYWLVKLDNNHKRRKQTINFEPIRFPKTFGDAPFALIAQASSGLPVSFEVISGPATVCGKIITLTGAGTVTVRATQAGNAAYDPAPDVTQTFVVEAGYARKIWDRTFSGGYYNGEELTAMAASPDGGYLLGGRSDADVSEDKSQPGYGDQDFWIIKIDNNGAKLWDKTFGGNSTDLITSIITTPDGGYLLGGYSYSGLSGSKSQASRGSADYWLLKIDANGNKLWDKTYGGHNEDILQAVITTPDGGYLLGGYSDSSISGEKTQAGKGSYDYWIVQIDVNGAKLWDQTYGGSNHDNLAALITAPNGGFLLGGTSASGISGDKTQATRALSDYWVIRINANGTKLWDKTFGGIKESYTSETCDSATTTNCREYFGNSYLSALAATPEGGFLLGGSSNAEKGAEKSVSNLGTNEHGYDRYLSDYWVVKITSRGDKIWDKTYGGIRTHYSEGNYYTGSSSLTSLISTPAGDYLLAGYSDSNQGGDKSVNSRGATDSSGGSPDYWVIKIKNNGHKVWDKTIGGSRDDQLTVAVSGVDGEYVLGGYSDSGINFDKTEGNKGVEGPTPNYWVVKIKDETVNLPSAWNLRFGGTSVDYFTDAIPTSDGGYLAGGYSVSNRSGDKSQNSREQKDYWIVKLDAAGKKLWDKCYSNGGEDFLNRVIQTQDGGYLLAGSSRSRNVRGERDFWVVKVDAQGNQQWDKTMGGNGWDDLKKVIQLSTGEYVLGGSSDSGAGRYKSQNTRGKLDYWLVKISNDGFKLWDKRYGGKSNELLGSFTATRDGGFLLGGTSWSGRSGDKSEASRGGSDYWVVKTDKDGNLLWEKTFGGSGQDEVCSVRRSHGDNFYLAGTSDSGADGDKSQNSQGRKDYWLIKLDEKGAKLWDRTFGGSQDDELRASTFTDEGHYILAGHSSSEVSGDKSQASQGGSDYWVVEVNENGDKVMDQRFGGSGQEELRTVFQTTDGGLLLGGRSKSGVSGDRTQPSQGDMDYWLVKVAPLTSALVATRQATPVEAGVSAEPVTLQAFPNPFTDRATIRFTLPQTQPVQVKVYDGQGREITTLFQGEAQANQNYQLEWRAHNEAAGMYLLQLQTITIRQQYKLLLRR